MKRLIGLAIILVLLFSLTACSQGLAAYKEDAKQQIESYACAKGEENYSTENWVAVIAILNAGKQAVDAAKNKSAVETALLTVKEEISAVQSNNTFPSVLANFSLDEFTDEFFENNTLILVPFEWSYLLYEHLDFYTAFAENGKLNFLIEVTDPQGGGDAALDMRLFAVIVPNEVLNGLEIGDIRVFETYDFSTANPTENSRDVLSEAEGKSVVHRVSLVPSEATIHQIAETIVISSMESLQEYFNI